MDFFFFFFFEIDDSDSSDGENRGDTEEGIFTRERYQVEEEKRDLRGFLMPRDDDL